MSRYLSRAGAILAIPALALTAAVVSATPAAAANPTYPFDWNINATTHIKKLDQTVKVPRGTFKGSVDLVTGRLTGAIALPPATSTVTIEGVGLATATFKIAPVKPVTGTVNFKTFWTRATSVFNIKVTKVSPVLAPSVNLVGSSCTTSKPVTVTMAGKASLTAASTFRGSYTIPPLKDCGATTLALNQLVPGPGNTFTAVASPK
jgi:hypothetical protein